jgi:hypothetical protein
MNRVTSFEERHESAIGARVETARVRVKTVALPVEHGGWGLSLEPGALGLPVAPSWPGLPLSVATMGAFPARHPFKIVAGDRRRGRRFPRTHIAERFVLLYGSVAALGLPAAFKTAASGEFLLPLLLAAPLASIQLFYDGLGGRLREAVAQLEASHPEATLLMRQVIDSLSYMGI